MKRALVLGAAATICTIPVVSYSEVVTYQYDVLGRLTQSFKQGGGSDGVLTTITNDAADNRSNYTVQNPTRVLHIGDKVYSSDNGFYVTLKPDGNLAVVKTPTGAELWTSGSTTLPTDHASFQSDGNLVIYGASNSSLWSTGTGGHPASQLTMQTDANLVITDPNGAMLWQTNTGPVDVSNPSTWTIDKDPAAVGTLSGRTFTAREDDGNGFVELHMPFTAVANLQYRVRFDATDGSGCRAVIPEGSGSTMVFATASGRTALAWTATSSGSRTAAIWCDATSTRTMTNVAVERIN